MRSHADGLVTRLFAARAAADVPAFRAMMASLCLRQPDGTLSTALLPADRLRRDWAGHSAFDPVLADAAGPNFRLLREATLSLGGTEPRSFVSLGHDALAKVAAAWKDEIEREAVDRKRRAQMRLLALGMAVALAVALGMGYLMARARWAEQRAEMNRGIAEAEKKKAEENRAEALAKKKEAEDSRALAEAEKKNADDSRKIAEAREKEARHLLARQYLAEGRDRMDRNDDLGALPFLVKSLDVDQADTAQATMHRERIGTVLRASPKLAHVWPHFARPWPEPVEEAPPAPAPVAPVAPVGARLLLPGFPPSETPDPWSEVHPGQHTGGPRRSTRLVGLLASANEPDPPAIRTLFRKDGSVPIVQATGSGRGSFSAPGVLAQCPSSGLTDSGLREAPALPGAPARARLEPVSFLAVSLDGKYALSIAAPTYPGFGSGLGMASRGPVRLWDLLAAGERPPVELPSPACHAAFSPDGRLVATAGDKVRLWTVLDGKPSGPVIDAAGARQVAFSPDGAKLVVVSANSKFVPNSPNSQVTGEVRVFGVADVQPRSPSLRYESAVSLATFSAGGLLLLTVEESGKLEVRDATLPGFPLLWKYGDAQNRINHAAFDPAGKLVAAGGSDRKARLFDAGPVRVWVPPSPRPVPAAGPLNSSTPARSFSCRSIVTADSSRSARRRRARGSSRSVPGAPRTGGCSCGPGTRC